MAQEAHNGGAQNGEAETAVGVAEKTVTFLSVKPQLFVEAPKANDAVQFYKAAFGAEEVNRVVHPKRKAEQELPLVLSAELQLGSFSFLVSDLTDDSPALVKGTGSVICLETEDVEAAVSKAVSAGAVSEGGEVAEGDGGACCGGGVGKLKDPFGNAWLICSPAKKCADVEA